MITGKRVHGDDGLWDIEATGLSSIPSHVPCKITSATEKRFARHEAIAILWRQGWSYQKVAIALGLHPGTVCRKFSMFREIVEESKHVETV